LSKLLEYKNKSTFSVQQMTILTVSSHLPMEDLSVLEALSWSYVAPLSSFVCWI